ncbi:MAG: glycosyltransferase family 39 protein [Clostridia bacterium]|jgi:4-amino-4-deoxy-L-arabinose transferase-like glycosyltransferase
MSNAIDRVQKIIIAFAVLIFAITVCQNFALLNNPSIYILIIIAVCAFCLLIYKVKISPKILIISILSFGFILRFVFILVVQTHINSDFAIMFDAAKKVAVGNFSCFDISYFQNWAYQTPFVLYQGLILKLFGSVFILKFLNVCFMTGIIFLIYLFARKIVSERAAAVAAFLYAIYPAPILLASVLTNQHISTFLIYLGIYMMLRKNDIRTLVISGVLLSLGNLMRPEGIIVIATILFVSLILILKCATAKDRIDILKKAGIVLVTYFLILASVGFAIKIAGINKNGISNKFPEWKFIGGLDNTTFGQYNKKDTYILDIKDQNLRRKEALKIIENSFKKGNGVIDFVYKKTSKMWACNESSFSTVFKNDSNYKNHVMDFKTNERKATGLMMYFDKSIYIFIFIAFIFSCILIILNKSKLKEKAFFFIVMISINYAVYLLIEIKTRYRYNIMPAIFIMSAASFILFEKINLKRKTKKT